MTDKSKNVVEFTNDAIKKITETGYYKFNVTKEDNKFGLWLRVSDTKSKVFVLRFTHSGKQDRVVLGTYPAVTLKMINSICSELADTKGHKSASGRWLINPKNYLEDKDNKISYKFQTISETPTIRQAIEDLCKDNFPRTNVEGSISKRHMGDMARFLIGYNWRLRHIEFTEHNGSGVMSFRVNPIFSRFRGFIKKVKPITNWDQLFKRFAAGDARYILTKEKHFNYTGVRSLYDDPLSKHLCTELNQGFMKNYINKYDTYGTKRNCLVALKYLRNYMAEKGYLGDNPGANPGQYVTIKRPLNLVANSVQYNNHIFTIEECERIEQSALKLRKDHYPIQAESILMSMKTGRRFPELCRLQKDFIKWNEKKIIVPKTISKIREDQFITITDEVKEILELVEEQKNRPGFERFNDTPWIFPTIRVLTSNDHSHNYLNSYHTRLKTVTNCWNAIKQDAGIAKGAIKTFRKTFSTFAKDQLGDKLMAMGLTGHTSPEVFEENYYKNHETKIKDNAHIVGSIFNFKAKRNTQLN